MITPKSYKIGTFMYAPANNQNILKNFQSWVREGLDSLAICFEDALTDADVPAAEQSLQPLLEGLQTLNDTKINIFIRVRNTCQFAKFAKEKTKIAQLINGFVFPKFDISNSKDYISIFSNSVFSDNCCFLPTLETHNIMSVTTRRDTLLELYKIISFYQEYVGGIRVGGSDFKGLYGLRQRIENTVYDIITLSSCLSDILNIFAQDFVVSAPVFEYFSGNFEKTLTKEARLDFLNGFIGKTVIHPAQIPIVKAAMKPSETEIFEARQLISADCRAVEKSLGGRMNEKNTHIRWAEKIIALTEST